MSHMLQEIHQQPEVIFHLLEREQMAAKSLADEIREKDIRFVTIAARGTSDHAAIYGKYLLEIENSMPVALADCSVFTLYNASLRLENTLVIGISQSGEATDVAEYLERSKSLGALTVAITNEADSTLVQTAEHSVLCHANHELGVAATKTYTSTLAALYLLSACLSGDDNRIEKLCACAEAMREVLKMQELIFDRVDRYRYMSSGYVLSRGFNYCTALEAALKLAETSYLGMLGYSAADFLHGPIAAVHEEQACLLIAPPGPTFDGMLDMANRLTERKAETVIISSENSILKLATTPFKMSVDIDEILSPLLYIIPAQLFAYKLAVVKGYDPDRPRGLTKVTKTR